MVEGIFKSFDCVKVEGIEHTDTKERVMKQENECKQASNIQSVRNIKSVLLDIESRFCNHS
jgi:hypothetical protein